MEIQNFRKAENIVSKIDSLKSILAKFKLGKVSKEKEFTHNNDDFYTADFFNIIRTKSTHNTSGGTSDLARISFYEFSDRSGAVYHLTKQEIIDLQEFIKGMIDKKLTMLEEELANIK